MSHSSTPAHRAEGRRQSIGTVALLLGTLSTPITAHAQRLAAGVVSTDPVRATAVAVRALPEPPRIDGRLDDPAWRSAAVITGFTQVTPRDGSRPTERTEVRILYCDDALYVGARLYDGNPGEIVSRLGRRDGDVPSDGFLVSIDSYHDHRTAFEFGVNPAAVRFDAVTSNDDGHGDYSWDPVWEAATSIDTVGWVVELRIPFSQLRFSAASTEWGINFYRDIFRKQEHVVWNWTPNTEQGYASRFGHLSGIGEIRQPRRLEVLPYTVASSDYTEGMDRANPFNDGSIYDITGGVDLKYGITSELTLDATVNPDFGQVEADPAVVNLTAFETRFEERRPFFVEGANNFRFGAGSGGFIFGAPELVYSRRIGAAPSRRVLESGGYVDNPAATDIVGAAKISGKTGGWSLGFMDAVTAREYARVQRADGSGTSEPVEPLTNYAVMSLRKDLRQGSSGIGILATSVHRDLENPLQVLPTAAYSAGVDFFHRFSQNQFAVNGTVSGSHIRGSVDAITRAQRAPARYFQRPDQGYVSLDPVATTMSGYAASIQAGKVAGSWTYGTDVFIRSPGFEINDVGFQQVTDRIFHGIRLGRRWLDPGRVFRNFRIDATWAQNWNLGGTLLSRGAYAGVGGRFLNYWGFNIGVNRGFTARSDKATRGGPLMETPSVWHTNARISSDTRQPVWFSTSGSYARNEYGGWGTEIGSDLTVRPATALSTTIAVRLGKEHAMGFYVMQLTDATAAATFGHRYVFSELVQTSVDVTVRADAAITPNLSVQLYAQPFIASGDYLGFKELAAPSTFTFVRYGQDEGSTLTHNPTTNVYTVDPDGEGPADSFTFANPDFLVRSLRSNLVLRWEYAPGSTVFLVWNHGRSGSAADPTFRAFDGIRKLFGDTQRNTFLVKVSYWISK